jgi:hypothetical protein
MGLGVDATECILNDLKEEEVGYVYLSTFYSLAFEAPRPSEWWLTNKGKSYLRSQKLI